MPLHLLKLVSSDIYQVAVYLQPCVIELPTAPAPATYKNWLRKTMINKECRQKHGYFITCTARKLALPKL